MSCLVLRVCDQVCPQARNAAQSWWLLRRTKTVPRNLLEPQLHHWPLSRERELSEARGRGRYKGLGGGSLVPLLNPTHRKGKVGRVERRACECSAWRATQIRWLCHDAPLARTRWASLATAIYRDPLQEVIFLGLRCRGSKGCCVCVCAYVGAVRGVV